MFSLPLLVEMFAYVSGLWSSVNFTLGAPEERQMLSGLHTVADIFCCCCGQIIGWKYVILFSYPLLISCNQESVESRFSIDFLGVVFCCAFKIHWC